MLSISLIIPPGLCFAAGASGSASKAKKAMAQPKPAQVAALLTAPEVRRTKVGLTGEYISWKEAVDLHSGAIVDKSTIDYIGFSLGGRWEKWKSARHGFELSANVMYGQAGLGRGQAGTLTSAPANKITWWGVGAAAKYLWSASEAITLGAGPFVIHRQVSISADPSGIEALTSAQENFGLSGIVRVRLGDIEIQQTLAAVTNQNSTLWAFGIGYIF